jgi:hypothetical protein
MTVIVSTIASSSAVSSLRSFRNFVPPCQNENQWTSMESLDEFQMRDLLESPGSIPGMPVFGYAVFGIEGALRDPDNEQE